MQRDIYDSFAQLSRVERERYEYRKVVRDRGANIVILAPHGGEIEPGTSELARAVAGNDLSLYCFEGAKGQHSRDLHLTSVNFDEPVCVVLVGRAARAVAIHGCKGAEAVVYVGGLDAVLSAKLIAALQEAGFDAQADDSHHAGNDPQNICNRGKSGAGVQLELTTELRRQMFGGRRWWKRECKTAIFASFGRAVREVLLEDNKISAR